MMPNARTRRILTALSGVVLAASPLAAQVSSPSIDTIRQNFLNPPPEARPMVRWWWFGPAVTQPEILRELQQMKADGIGGAELAFVYPEVLDEPSKDLKNLPFLSSPMLEAVSYAQAEGRKLGLRIDVTLCSGWPYGGPNTTLSEAATRLRVIEAGVPPKATRIPSPTILPLPVREGHIPSGVVIEGDKLLSVSIGPGEPKHWNAATMEPANGLDVSPSPTPRVALLFYMSHTFQQVKRAAAGAEGYVLDPFSKQAVATHLAKVGEPLVDAFENTPPYAIFSDSLEAYGADWTPTLLGEFRKRRGYDLAPHLPELVAGGSVAADNIRHDYGRTLTELVNENYLTQINDWAKAHHTLFRSQTYGDPAVDFSSQNLVGLAEGEGPQWRAFSTLRWASSANHVFDHNVTSGETFTWLHSPVFRATPLDMKAEADIDFIMGENQLIYHGWPYSPPDHEVPEPGWSLYAAASFNDHNPWWPVEASVNKYIARLSFLMRQGQPANQVAILLPEDDAWASFSPTHTTMTGALAKLITPELMSAILSAGYNVDFIDAEAVDKVGLGTHRILVLPATDRMPLETLRKIRDFADRGGKVFAVGRVPTLDGAGKASPELTKLSEAIALVPNPANLAKAMTGAVTPDLRMDAAPEGKPLPNSSAMVSLKRSLDADIGYIHRKLPDADIYFVANTSNHSSNIDVTFATNHKSGEQLDPETGQSSSAFASELLILAPYESRTFVFSDTKNTLPLISQTPGDMSLDDKGPWHTTDLSRNWNVNFTSANRSVNEPSLTDWTASPETLHYSGEAVYTRDFNLTSAPNRSAFLEVDGGSPLPGFPNSAPEHDLLPNGLPNPQVTRTGPGMHAYFDPPIHEAALVFINGQEAGALWHPPYRLEVSKLLKAGTNHIEIHVYNTALNAWSALPPHDYGPLKAKYGDRFQMQDLDKVKPIPSGIIGTVKLVTQEPQ